MGVPLPAEAIKDMADRLHAAYLDLRRLLILERPPWPQSGPR
jgi:hypothetical protein